jgi:hypothetical protein
MFGILFLKIFPPKSPQLIQNGVSKQNSPYKVFVEDSVQYLETIENVEK